jgi:hypothetical protein
MSEVGGSLPFTLGGDAREVGPKFVQLSINPGENSLVAGTASGILGGSSNTLSARTSVICGGSSNNITFSRTLDPNQFSSGNFVGAGSGNVMYSDGTSGGRQLTNNVICGGTNNSVHIVPAFSQAVKNNFIGGGTGNHIISAPVSFTTAENNVIGGGIYNTLTSSRRCFIAGGSSNTLYRCSDTIAIGNNNDAVGSDGTCLIGDSSPTLNTADANNQLRARFASGYKLFTNDAQTTGATMTAGLSAWSAVSSRESKQNIVEPNYSEILSLLSSVPICYFEYKERPDARFIGPMADDWSRVFGLGPPENAGARIDTITPAGVALACIRGLILEIEALKSRISKQ